MEGQQPFEFTSPWNGMKSPARVLEIVPRGPLMSTMQVPKSFTHVLRRLQRHPRQPFYELVLAQFGLLAKPAGDDEPP